MPTNCLGELFTVSLFGESHGKCIGSLVSGCPSNLELNVEEIQKELNKRRPGQSVVTTQRKEEDLVDIRTGLSEGKTTGMPILLVIDNKDADSSKYDALKTVIRPGHADFTYRAKYGTHDYKGGGFSSGRLTAGIVAAGAIAKKILRNSGINIVGYTKAIGEVEAQVVDFNEIEKNEVRCPDSEKAKEMKARILEVQSQGDSIGGLIEVIATGLPAGIGGPRFNNLKGALDKAFHSSGAITDIGYGAGAQARYMKGSEFNDIPYILNSLPNFRSNNSGGIQGGISNSNSIVARLTIRPTPSISSEQKTIDTNNDYTLLNLRGRHDPCLCPRMIPVSEALMAVALVDFLLKQRAYR